VPAIIGSAAVALAVCVVAWSVDDPVVATIMCIAVLTIAALAVWSGRDRRCHPRGRRAPTR
jgi:Flp pilus assembly protein TadB